jgi:hypothetical protein
MVAEGDGGRPALTFRRVASGVLEAIFRARHQNLAPGIEHGHAEAGATAATRRVSPVTRAPSLDAKAASTVARAPVTPVMSTSLPGVTAATRS